MERVEALRSVHFLKSLPDSTIAALAAYGETQQFQKGEVIFFEKSRCMGLTVVLTGAVKVFKLDARGRELILDLERPGESVGEVALFDGGNYPANAQAEGDGTRLLIVSRDRFWDIAGQHPEVMRHGLKAMGVRTHKLLQMLEAQALYPVRARLAEYLIRTAEDRTHFQL